LEAAFGPGYLALELAKLEEYRITGLDKAANSYRSQARRTSSPGLISASDKGMLKTCPSQMKALIRPICTSAFKNIPDQRGALKEV